MKENKTNKTVRGNLVGIMTLPNKQGKPESVVTLEGVRLNTEAKVHEFKSGTRIIRFLSSVYGTNAKTRISHAMNGAEPKETPYGLSIDVSVYPVSDKQHDYLLEKLKKGARIKTLQGIMSVYSTEKEPVNLQLKVNGSNLSWIEAPEDRENKENDYDLPPFEEEDFSDLDNPFEDE